MQNLNQHPLLSLFKNKDNENSNANANAIANAKENTPYLFIDGSYFCFYCYYSIERWWKLSYPNELDVLKNPSENPVFVEKFIQKCRKTIDTLPKQLGMQLTMEAPVKPMIYIGKDCKRENIWRNQFYPGYKANRDNNRNKNVGPFFTLLYKDWSENEFYKKQGLKEILEFEALEADDCIAICVMNLLNEEPERNIYIVTSDRDYLQLAKTPQIRIFDLSYKNLLEAKGSSGNAECDLFCKIVMGDKSDNITSIFKKCGPKTALKYFQNRELFELQLKKENAYEKYKRNEKIISFQYIPLPMN